MAPKAQDNTKDFSFLNPAYDSFTSPVAPHDEPYLVSGLNLRTSNRGWIERAPGSSAYEGTPTAEAAWKRVFVYRKWNGDTYIMACKVTATQSIAYKLKVGTDSAFQSLYTSTLGSTATSGPNSPTISPYKGNYTGPDGGSVAWTSYANILASDNARAANGLSHPETTKMIVSAGYGFAIPENATVVGITAEIEKRNATAAPGTCEDSAVYLFKNSVHVGSNKSAAGNWPTSDAYSTYGGASDVWGTTWTPQEVNASGFGVGISAISNSAAGAVPEVDHMRITIHYTLPVQAFDFVVANNTLYYGNGGECRSYDGTLERKMGITAPTTAPTMTNAGSGITATVGWRYVYCYKDSIKGHISSPSPTSASTGAITDDTITVTVTGVALGSTGVDKIQIFRSTDGGNGIFFYVGEIDNPGATTDTYADTTADSSLNTQFSQQAPPSNYNDPAPPMLGLKHFANRIWGFLNNTLYYSGWEEINTGREEESFPSGVTGNEWNAPQEIMALATIGGDDPVALLIFCRSRTFMVTGDSRDTFSFHELFPNLGTNVKVTGVAEDGDRVFFMGNDNRIYATDGRGKELVSESITDDLLNVASTECAMVVHRYGEANWLVVADAGGSTAAVVATSATSPATGTSEVGSGTAWTNPTNIATSNNTYATSSITLGNSTNKLRAAEFGFAIPTTASITGILVEVEGKMTATGGGSAHSVSVTLDRNGTQIGSAISSSNPFTGSDAYVSFGGSGNTFGGPILPAQLNDSLGGVEFGVNVVGTGVDTGVDFSIDHVRVTVYYSLVNGPRWFVLDLTTGKWMPPWSKSALHLHSGETSTDSTVLLYCSYDASSNTIVRKLDIAPETESWTEANGGQGNYPVSGVLSLTQLAPPRKVYELNAITYQRNDSGSPTAPALRAKFDEVNSGVTWSSETALTQVNPTLRTQGTTLIEKQANPNPTISGRNLLLRFDWDAENKNFKLLSFALHSREVGPKS